MSAPLGRAHPHDHDATDTTDALGDYLKGKTIPGPASADHDTAIIRVFAHDKTGREIGAVSFTTEEQRPLVSVSMATGFSASALGVGLFLTGVLLLLHILNLLRGTWRRLKHWVERGTYNLLRAETDSLEELKEPLRRKKKKRDHRKKKGRKDKRRRR